MLINEVCKKCSLTKKAVEYYIEQGLVVPTMQENGYRSFTEEDAERLTKISILRNLDLSVADIGAALSDRNESLLKEISGKKKLEITALQEKQNLLQELADKHDWEHVYDQLRQFGKLSGYNDIFIPAMCRLSKSYREYHEALRKADEKWSQQVVVWPAL